jgi:hypothetical protein
VGSVRFGMIQVPAAYARFSIASMNCPKR